MMLVTTTITDGVADIRLTNPPVNALSSEVYRQLATAIDRVSIDLGVSVVLLTSSSDRVFCAGADVTELATLTGPEATAANAVRQALAREVFDKLQTLDRPTIAVVNGPAIGAGAVLASCCDFRLGSDRATFRLPEIDLARAGGGRHLMRHLPQGVLRRMYFTAQPLSASRAYALGFIDELHGSDDLERAATDIAADIAKKSPLALRIAKQSLTACEELGVSDGYAREQEFTMMLAQSLDAAEAVRARNEGRRPRFTGH